MAVIRVGFLAITPVQRWDSCYPTVTQIRLVTQQLLSFFKMIFIAWISVSTLMGLMLPEDSESREKARSWAPNEHPYSEKPQVL